MPYQEKAIAFVGVRQVPTSIIESYDNFLLEYVHEIGWRLKCKTGAIMAPVASVIDGVD